MFCLKTNLFLKASKAKLLSVARCLKLFTMITMCFMEDKDASGVMLLRIKDTLTVAAMNAEEHEAEELVYSAANAFVDSHQRQHTGETH
jgi:hypothetical protein